MLASSEATFETPARPTKVLLVDDDLVFGKIMSEVAREEGIELQVHDSLLSLGYLGSLKNYDAIILDYHLEHLNGLEIATYLDSFLNDMPAVLISNGDMQDVSTVPWPVCLHTFVPKQRGYKAILEAARDAISKKGSSH